MHTLRGLVHPGKVNNYETKYETWEAASIAIPYVTKVIKQILYCNYVCNQSNQASYIGIDDILQTITYSKMLFRV